AILILASSGLVPISDFTFVVLSFPWYLGRRWRNQRVFAAEVGSEAGLQSLSLISPIE
ncbi:hypothetical protein LINPERPRIM_LOCUS14942, partial [Linum perenne]